MAVAKRTSTIKNKHATAKSGIKSSKDASRRAPVDGVTKSKSYEKRKGTAPKHVRPLTATEAKAKAYKLRTFTAKELGVRELNKITPVGVAKPRGQKKGKIFIDDTVNLIPSIMSPLPLPPPTSLSLSLSQIPFDHD